MRIYIYIYIYFFFWYGNFWSCEFSSWKLMSCFCVVEPQESKQSPNVEKCMGNIVS